MTKPDLRLQGLQGLEETLRDHRKTCGTDLKSRALRAWLLVRRQFRKRLVRRIGYPVAGAVALIAIVFAGLWLRLALGPIQIDFVSPWIASAIEQNLGRAHRVAIGGTQIERDNSGRTAVLIRDMQVRDSDGSIVAVAPKAEVAISSASLLRGDIQAHRVSLVGAELSIRIEQDGQISISTGADKRPLTVTPAVVKAAPAPAKQTAAPGASLAATGAERFIGLIGWLDRISNEGLDGDGLGEIGLKNGTLKVDDLRTDKHWVFEQINLSVNRPGRGVSIRLSSDDEARPWALAASIRQTGVQRRLVSVDLNRVSTKDLFLATRIGSGQFHADIPLSGAIRAEIGPDSLPRLVEGKIVAGGGLIGDPADIGGHFHLDRGEFTLDWDSTRRNLLVQSQFLAGANRFTLLGRFDAPAVPQEPWRVTVTGGSIVLADGANDPQPVVLNKILLRAHLDLVRQRIELLQGDIAGAGIAGFLNGSVEFGTEPRLAAGIAVTPMSAPVMKKVWPVFVATKVRNWVVENVENGDIERIDIATNSPIDNLREDGPPIPHDGLSVDITVRNATIRPVVGMPPITEADLKTTIKGRRVMVTVGRGFVDLGGGRRLTVSNGVFEVPDTHPKAPPARAQFRIDGPVPAALELLASERLRGQAAVPMDSSNSRGNLSGQVTVNLPITKDPPPGATQYAITLDVAGFAADRMVMGQKIEAQALKVSADNLGYQIKGDVRINGVPASLDYRKAAESAEADVQVRAVLDDAARARFGFATGSALAGPVPVRISGKIADNRDVRLSVEADLTAAKIENLLPGWVKPPGRQNRATFTVLTDDKSTRFDDIVIDGSGVNVRGNAELDDKSELISAHFPVFALSDGDKISVRAERGTDNALRVSLRGDVYDGRNFVKAFFGGGESSEKPKDNPIDLDVDMRLGVIAGHNGETLRGVEMRMARRGGQIRSFALKSAIGQNASLTGEMRASAQRKNMLHFETQDAGALMRFTDTYPRIQGGQMAVAMEVPTPDQAPQEGIVSVQNFAVRGEPKLSAVVGGQNDTRGVDFNRMRVDFTRTPGRLLIKEGIVQGPVIGATIEGTIDYAKNDVRMRGTIVPLYGINNPIGQLPLVGAFLGGPKEGLFGFTYQVVGPPGAPVLNVNPASGLMPGFLRKIFEFPTARPLEPVEASPGLQTIR